MSSPNSFENLKIKLHKHMYPDTFVLGFVLKFSGCLHGARVGLIGYFLNGLDILDASFIHALGAFHAYLCGGRLEISVWIGVRKARCAL